MATFEDTKVAFILKPGFVMGQVRSVPEFRVWDGEIITLELDYGSNFEDTQNKQKLTSCRI